MPSKNIDIEKTLELRTVVLALGETTNFGWWKSQFLSPTGLSFLERLYPHTYFSEAVRSGTLAALEIHDMNIGKGRVFHLFRLSQSVEREVEFQLKDNGNELAASYRNLVIDRQKLLTILSSLAEGLSVEPAIGPLSLNVHSDKVVPTLAAYYLQAFMQEKQVFPYFEDFH